MYFFDIRLDKDILIKVVVIIGYLFYRDIFG